MASSLSGLILSTLLAELLERNTPTMAAARRHPYWSQAKAALPRSPRSGPWIVRDTEGGLSFVIEEDRIFEPEDWAHAVVRESRELSAAAAAIFGEITRREVLGGPVHHPMSPWEVRAIAPAGSRRKSERVSKESTGSWRVRS